MRSVVKSVSVIVPTYNRCDDVRLCLCSLRELDYAKDRYEIIVIDDGSEDETLRVIEEEFPEVILLRNEVRRGACFSRNRAVAAASHRYVAFIDSDAIAPRGWLKNLSRYMDEGSILGGEVINYYTHRVEFGPRRTTFLGGSISTSEERANVAISCNMVVPVKVFRRLGGFDENILVYFEESDFCIRARQLGYQVKFVSGAEVLHKRESRKAKERIYLHTLNRTYAMLRIYRESCLRVSSFLALSTIWAFLQSLGFFLRADLASAVYVPKGFLRGIAKFLRVRSQ